MTYEDIIFLQDSEAEEALNILDTEGKEKAFDYLQQWNYGDSPVKTCDSTPWGLRDKLYEKDDYVMSYNLSLSYIGLIRVIK